MPKIAVHLHLYYLDMWPEIKRYLVNLDGFDFDLYVTMVTEDRKIMHDIDEFCPGAKVKIVANKGYDVAPFLSFLKEINLDAYDYILKVHTKNKFEGVNTLINHHYISRSFWYKLLFNSLLGSRKILRQNLKAFEKDRLLGMIGSKYLITSEYSSYKAMEAQIRAEFMRMGFAADSKIIFVAGTMFMIRSALLKPLLAANYRLDEFDDVRNDVHDFTLAHIMERVFGSLVAAQGYKLGGVRQDLSFCFNSYLYSVKRFCFQRKITKNKNLLIKAFKLPVYNRKIDL